jgi:hypothetical protein
MVCSAVFLSYDAFQRQLIVTTKGKREKERFIYFSRFHAERQKMSGLKELIVEIKRTVYSL